MTIRQLQTLNSSYLSEEQFKDGQMKQLILMTCLASTLMLSHINSFSQQYELYKKLCDTTISSSHLGFDKNITVTVPIDWQANIDCDYPLIVAFDRQNERSHNFIIRAIDYLTSNDQMPAAVIIGIESGFENRYKETLHPITSADGMYYEMESFLFDELIPLAEKQFKASDFRLFVGHSRYGYFTSALLCSRTMDLNGVISLSPFFGQLNVDLTDSIAQLESDTLTNPLYYRYGIGKDYPEDFQKMDSVLKTMKNPQFNASGVIFPQAEHNVTPGLTITTALYEIFEKWSELQSLYFSEEVDDMEIVKEILAKIARHYGKDLPFSIGTLNGKGWYFFNKEEYEMAIEAWTLLMQSYPNFSEGYLYIMHAQKKLGLDIEQTIKQFEDSFEKSEMYSPEERTEIEAELDKILSAK